MGADGERAISVTGYSQRRSELRRSLRHFQSQTNQYQLVGLEEALYRRRRRRRPTVEARAVRGMHIARLNCERTIRGFDVYLLKTESVSSMSVRFQLSVCRF